MDRDDIAAAAVAWARENWPGSDPGGLAVEPIAADGSPRLFLRLMAPGQSLVVMAAPDPEENRAWHGLGLHLARLGLPVARILAADLGRGFFLMEDLGRTSLQEAALAAKHDPEALLRLYRPVLAMLARLAATGHQGLDITLCFDSAELNEDFLFEREAGYFLREMVADALGLGAEAASKGLERDLAEICRRAGRAGPKGFTHRDFQSRNIILQGGRVGLVDYQGGRLGPAQYDLAALVNDPYVDLPQELRDRLLAEYIAARSELGGFAEEEFRQGYPFVAASRIMQALGAYAFLTRRRGRGHFYPYIKPAVATLQHLAGREDFADLPHFARLAGLLPNQPPASLFTPVREEKP